jgi:hypothetical protein
MASALATAPRVESVRSFDLTGTIQYQRDCLGRSKYTDLGRLLNIRLGIDDAAQYATGEAWRRVSRTSKIMGLTLEWKNQEAPIVCMADDRQTVLLKHGIRHMPTLVATVFGNRIHRDPTDTRELPRLPQRLSDYASGRLMGKDRTGFLILQPVEQLIVLAFGVSTMLNMRGFPVDNRHPFLLVSPKGPEAYIAGGMLGFD